MNDLIQPIGETIDGDDDARRSSPARPTPEPCIMTRPRSLEEAIDALADSPIGSMAKRIAREQLKELIEEMLAEAREKGRELEREDWNGAAR